MIIKKNINIAKLNDIGYAEPFRFLNGYLNDMFGICIRVHNDEIDTVVSIENGSVVKASLYTRYYTNGNGTDVILVNGEFVES